MGWQRSSRRCSTRSIALRTLGYSPELTRFIERRARISHGLFVDDPEDFRIQPCLSPVWDTAINIIALAESGFPAQHPALQKAAQLAGRTRRCAFAAIGR